MKILTIILTILTVCVAAIYDYKYRKIPNVITFSSMVLGLGLHTLHADFDGFCFSLFGLLAGLGTLVILYLLGVCKSNTIGVAAYIKYISWWCV